MANQFEEILFLWIKTLYLHPISAYLSAIGVQSCRQCTSEMTIR